MTASSPITAVELLDVKFVNPLNCMLKPVVATVPIPEGELGIKKWVPKG